MFKATLAAYGFATSEMSTTSTEAAGSHTIWIKKISIAAGSPIPSDSRSAISRLPEYSIVVLELYRSMMNQVCATEIAHPIFNCSDCKCIHCTERWTLSGRLRSLLRWNITARHSTRRSRRGTIRYSKRYGTANIG